jgi:hypothetical protein
MLNMRHDAHNQAQVKVAVYAAQASQPVFQQRLAIVLIGLSALGLFWIG